MANHTREFILHEAHGEGLLVSDALITTHRTGVIQVFINTPLGFVTLQGRLDEEAPWVDLQSWNLSKIEQVPLVNQVRIITNTSARCWLSEVV